MNFKKFLYTALFIVGIIGGMVSCDKRENFINFAPGITDNVLQVAKKSGLTLFAAAFERAQLDTAFTYLGNYTIFAPTNEAFQAAGITAAVINNMTPEMLRILLRNHILPGRTTAQSFLPGPNAAYNNINRDFLYTSFYANSGTFFNGAKIVKTDITANNGVIHTVDAVLGQAIGNLTQTLNANPNTTFFAAAIIRSGLDAALNGSTAALNVFAPTNAAFQAAGYADIAAINAAPIATIAAIVNQHIIVAANATASGGRLFTPDIRTGTYTSRGGAPIIATVTGSTIGLKGGSATTDANITTPNLLFRTLISTGAPSVLHIINRVITP